MTQGLRRALRTTVTAGRMPVLWLDWGTLAGSSVAELASDLCQWIAFSAELAVHCDPEMRIVTVT